RTLVASGVDPSVERRLAKASSVVTFELIAREWLDLQQKIPPNRKRAPISKKTAQKTKHLLETYLFPKLGSRPIGTIHAAELLAELRKMEKKGINESAHRARSIASRV